MKKLNNFLEGLFCVTVVVIITLVVIVLFRSIFPSAYRVMRRGIENFFG